MLLWLYLISLICAVLLLWLRDRQRRKLFAGIQTLPLLPFIGNIHQFINFGDGKGVFKNLVNISEACEKSDYGRLVVWLGPVPFLVVQNPEDIKSITNSFIEKVYVYNFGKVWLGDGLVTAPGSIFMRNIKKLGGTFTTSVVDGYLNVFNEQAKKLVEKLKMEVESEPFDILERYLAYMTLETICETALGVSNISGSLVTTEYYTAFNRCLQLLIRRGLNIFMHLECLYKLTPDYREMKKCVEVLHQVSEKVIKQRRRERYRTRETKYNIVKEENRDSEVKKFKPFIDILLDLSEIGPSLTDVQIKSEVDTIIVGGQETVASTLFFTLLMIGSNSNIQEKLYTEIKNIFGDSKRSVTKHDLGDLKYLEAVIYETLRLFPPVPNFMRYADRDLHLDSLKLPKGTNCSINVWGAGRSVRLWGNDAALYRPERWLDDQFSIHPAAFLAFSYGRRACIGKKYAMAMLKIVLAHCIRELQFMSEADKMELKIDVALRPISGHLIQVKQRC